MSQKKKKVIRIFDVAQGPAKPGDNTNSIRRKMFRINNNSNK